MCMLKHLEGRTPALRSFSGSSVGKESVRSAGNLGSIPGSERSPEEGNGNPLQCSSLENPVDRGAWRPTVHGVAESWATECTQNRSFNTANGLASRLMMFLSRVRLGAFASKATCRGSSASKLFLSLIFIIII